MCGRVSKVGWEVFLALDWNVCACNLAACDARMCGLQFEPTWCDLGVVSEEIVLKMCCICACVSGAPALFILLESRVVTLSLCLG